MGQARLFACEMARGAGVEMVRRKAELFGLIASVEAHSCGGSRVERRCRWKIIISEFLWYKVRRISGHGVGRSRAGFAMLLALLEAASDRLALLPGVVNHLGNGGTLQLFGSSGTGELVELNIRIKADREGRASQTPNVSQIVGGVNGCSEASRTLVNDRNFIWSID